MKTTFCGIIELSEEQKLRLCKMAEKISENDEYLQPDSIEIERHNLSNNKFITFGYDSGWNRIHWYEFCFEHIIPYLCNKSSSKEGLVTKMTFTQAHPVDILYAEFLDLNLL